MFGFATWSETNVQLYSQFASSVFHTMLSMKLQTRELGSSGPYAMLFCLDDLDKKKA